MKPHGVILAGGLARRMGGGDKGLTQVAGASLLARLAARLRPQCAALALNANGDPARFVAYGMPVLADALPDNPGPLAGVLTAMEWAASEGAAQVLTVPWDTPFIPDDLAARLAAAGPLACAATGDRTHPPVGLWPVALAEDLRAALSAGERKIDRWTSGHGCAAVSWPGEPYDPFFNVNRPEDLAEAERIAALIA